MHTFPSALPDDLASPGRRPCYPAATDTPTAARTARRPTWTPSGKGKDRVGITKIEFATGTKVRST
eukprot:5366196-Amphidinium_carterae.1